MAFLLIVATVFVLAETPAFAYVDPGSASYLFQIIIGGALGGVFLARSFIVRMRDSIRDRFFGSRTGR